MHVDCRLGYSYFDSVCRTIRTRDELLALAGRIRSWETAKMFACFLYRMSEYDADLFEEYRDAGAALNSQYQVIPAVEAGVLRDRIDSILGMRSKLMLLIDASTILRIHVDAVYDDVDSFASTPVYPLPLRCVYASVVDTIKGQHWRLGVQPLSAMKVNRQTVQPEINFIFSRYWQKVKSRGDAIFVGIDASGHEHVPCDSCYDINALEAGKNYIVYLNSVLLDYDGVHSFYNYFPCVGYSQEGGFFEIDASNNVLIPSNFFGYGKAVPLATFMSRIRQDISSITSH
jgi:hypothetical protein